MINTLLKNKKELFLYGICGAGSTIINIISFWFLRHYFSLPLIGSNILAWILAFLFAFITNRTIVFKSKSNQITKEFLSFFLTRTITLLLDMLLIWILVELFTFSPLISKVIDNIIIILINYICAKLYTFKDPYIFDQHQHINIKFVNNNPILDSNFLDKLSEQHK